MPSTIGDGPKISSSAVRPGDGMFVDVECRAAVRGGVPSPPAASACPSGRSRMPYLVAMLVRVRELGCGVGMSVLFAQLAPSRESDPNAETQQRECSRNADEVRVADRQRCADRPQHDAKEQRRGNVPEHRDRGSATGSQVESTIPPNSPARRSAPSSRAPACAGRRAAATVVIRSGPVILVVRTRSLVRQRRCGNAARSFRAPSRGRKRTTGTYGTMDGWLTRRATTWRERARARTPGTSRRRPAVRSTMRIWMCHSTRRRS